MARMQEIERLYQPHFHTAEGQLYNKWLKLRARYGTLNEIVANGEFTAAEVASLNDYTDYNVRVAELMNATIKDISGAAVSASEEERLMEQLVSKKDDYISARRKIKVFREQLESALMRYNYYNNTGLLEGMTDKRKGEYLEERHSLDSMNDFVNQEGVRILNEAIGSGKYEGMPVEDIRKKVVEPELRRLFGL